MKKADEINLLENLIAQTPRDSYLRSMLDHLKPQFESDIRSDFSTLPNLRETEREIYEQKQVVLDLRKLQEKVRQEILDQRQECRLYYSRLRDLQDDLKRALEAVGSAIARGDKQ